MAVIVAHPDDETLWAGGLLLGHPEWEIFIASVCRGSDYERSPRFLKATECLNAKGAMADLDDGPEQSPLAASTVQDTILSLLPWRECDILLTHSPCGEYTWHRRHEEVADAVRTLWQNETLRARSLWQFAYSDAGGTRLPEAREEACFQLPLPAELWTKKFRIITEVYGFKESTWEARAVPRSEAFCCFTERE